MLDLALIKPSLMGPNFKRLLKSLKTTKWRVSKDCNVTYRTLINWQGGKTIPSDELAKRVGKYLGLIKPDELEIREIEEQIMALKSRLDRIKEKVVTKKK
jgi:DNA-binding XRE family transcriptional regulator